MRGLLGGSRVAAHVWAPRPSRPALLTAAVELDEAMAVALPPSFRSTRPAIKGNRVRGGGWPFLGQAVGPPVSPAVSANTFWPRGSRPARVRLGMAPAAD